MTDADIAWARRVSPRDIRRLYQIEALGVLDEDLIDEVGFGLYARCQSILDLTDAYRGRVHCPRCWAVIEMRLEGRRNDTPIACACGWRTTWLDYKKTTGRDKRLRAGGAERVFADFVRAFDARLGPRRKMLLIDGLLHEFHRGRKGESGPLAANVIEGRRDTIVEMLDDLFSSENKASEQARWRARLNDSLYGRRRAVTEEMRRP